MIFISKEVADSVMLYKINLIRNIEEHVTLMARESNLVRKTTPKA